MKPALLIVLGILLCCVLPLLNLNPFVLMFQSKFEVVNRSAEDIRITPMGIVEGGADCRPLPLYAWDVPNVPALRRGGFALRPHESRSFVYDRDDIFFDRILVQSPSGSHYTRVISRPRGRGDVFEIGLLSELPESDAPIAEAAVRFRYAPKRVLILWLPWLGPVLLVWGSVLIGRRMRTAKHAAAEGLRTGRHA